MPKLDLPKFEEALRENPEAAKALGRMSYRRYLDGEFPAAIRWLMRFPAVGRALMVDAENLARELAVVDNATKTKPAQNKPAARGRQRRAS